MLTEIHFILTYACNFECDHCFLYCSPKSKGAFTISQVTRVLDESKKIGAVKWITYEGGEPFLFYPLLKEGIKRAHAKGFKVAVVTNAYGANSEEDAELWLNLWPKRVYRFSISAMARFITEKNLKTLQL